MERQDEHLYGELRRMAGSFLRRERNGHTLQPTALANEAFLQVGSAAEKWDNTAHFFGAAARAMRQILIQHARGRRAQKRGGEAMRVTLSDVDAIGPAHAAEEQCDIDEALGALRQHDPGLLRLVELRFFYGHTLEEVATITGRSLASVKRDWNYTRAWLCAYLTR